MNGATTGCSLTNVRVGERPHEHPRYNISSLLRTTYYWKIHLVAIPHVNSTFKFNLSGSKSQSCKKLPRRQSTAVEVNAKAFVFKCWKDTPVLCALDPWWLRRRWVRQRRQCEAHRGAYRNHRSSHIHRNLYSFACFSSLCYNNWEAWPIDLVRLVRRRNLSYAIGAGQVGVTFSLKDVPYSVKRVIRKAAGSSSR